MDITDEPDKPLPEVEDAVDNTVDSGNSENEDSEEEKDGENNIGDENVKKEEEIAAVEKSDENAMLPRKNLMTMLPWKNQTKMEEELLTDMMMLQQTNYTRVLQQNHFQWIM